MYGTGHKHNRIRKDTHSIEETTGGTKYEKKLMEKIDFLENYFGSQLQPSISQPIIHSSLGRYSLFLF